MRILFVNFILLSTLAYADFYYISYKYVVKDFQLYNEKILVSRAMQSCSGTINQSIVFQKENNDTFENFIKEKKQKMIDFFDKLGLYVKSHDSFDKINSHTNTTITFFTQCFKVDFNDNFVKISALKQPNK